MLGENSSSTKWKKVWFNIITFDLLKIVLKEKAD